MSVHIPVSVSRTYRATPERVFDAWLDVETASQFMFATEHGKIVRAEIDPRVGGQYVITDRRGEEDVEHAGEYHDIDRPRRLVFSFGLPAYSPNFDRICLDIEPAAEGAKLTLTHELKRDFAEFAERSRQGWSAMLERLAKVVETPV